MAGEYTGPRISGVPVADISEIAGVSKTLIRGIGGVLTVDLGFGPDYYSGPTCQSFTATYSSVSLINAANSEDYITVEFDTDNNILYAQESCGSTYADTGFYVIDNGRRLIYYSWNANAQVLIELDPPPTGPTATVAPSFGVSQLVFKEYPSITRGIWTGTGNISYTYKFYSDGGLISTQGPFPVTDSKGNVSDSQPSFVHLANYLFTTIRLEVLATDDIGTTTEYVDIRMTESKLNAFLANSGITDSMRVAALEYLQKALITGNLLRAYNTGAPILDYYPFAGDSEYQNRWSLGNSGEYLNFSGDWSHSSNGSQNNGGTATSTKIWNNPYSGYNLSIGAYNSNAVSEDSIDLSLQDSSTSWDFGINRTVNGARKHYFKRPGGSPNTNTPSGGTGVGMFEMYYHVTATMNGSYDNYISIYDAANTDVNNGGYTTDYLGQFVLSAPSNLNFVIGGNNSTKNYQFAYNGWGAAGAGLESIIQTYNSMLGR